MHLRNRLWQGLYVAGLVDDERRPRLHGARKSLADVGVGKEVVSDRRLKVSVVRQRGSRYWAVQWTDRRLKRQRRKSTGTEDEREARGIADYLEAALEAGRTVEEAWETLGLWQGKRSDGNGDAVRAG